VPPPRVSVLIPAYEEERFIEGVVRRVIALDLDCEVIAVDDGSRDGTAGILRALEAELPAVRAIVRPVNGGKGAALRDAIAASTGDFVVVQDADLEYDPADIPGLIAPILEGHADVVYGSRLIGGRPQRVHLFWHKVGNKALSLVTNVLYNTTLSDMETGYKAFTLEVLRAIEPLHESDFRIEPELTAKICRGGFRVYEVPISYYGRSYAEGKKITWRDGFPALYALVKYRFKD
jgi:glycosyltransferase involved in cell wall biosynthesis